jgi:hypothetical protein
VQLSNDSVIPIQKGEKAMPIDTKVRWGWLKFMYIYTIIGAGGVGLGIILIPQVIQSVFRFPGQDPIVFGSFGSAYIAFGLVSILGLRSPLNFVPVLLLQLCYKVIWSIAVASPLFFSGGLPMHAALLLVIFVTYIIGDLIAIPFSYVFKKDKLLPVINKSPANS